MGVVALYHGNCNDGWCSAYILKRKFPEAKIISVLYGTKADPYIERATGNDVYILDFCFEFDAMKEIVEKANKVTIIDHHEGASAIIESLRLLEAPNLNIVFEHKNESGASLTYKSLYPGEQIPWWVEYTAANDIGNWNILPDQHLHMSYISSFKKNEEDWDEMIREYEADQKKALDQCVGISRVYALRVEEIAKSGTLIDFEGITTVAAACSPKAMASGVANAIAGVYGLGIAYVIMDKDGVPSMEISLRSRKNSGIDCIKLAQKYGGSGHQQAAGIPISVYEGLCLLNIIDGNIQKLCGSNRGQH